MNILVIRQTKDAYNKITKTIFPVDAIRIQAESKMVMAKTGTTQMASQTIYFPPDADIKDSDKIKLYSREWEILTFYTAFDENDSVDHIKVTV